MRNTNKKGFTIVELVIVVAVIAILAAVLIPTFSSIIKKANLSADQQAVRNMNTAAAIGAAEGSYKNPSDVLDALYAHGFNLGKMKTYSNGFHYAYNYEDNKVYLLDESDNVIYPEEVSKDKLWGFYYNSVGDILDGVNNYIAMQNLTNVVNFQQAFAEGTYKIDLNGYYIDLKGDDTAYNVTVLNGAYISGGVEKGEGAKTYTTLAASAINANGKYENVVVTGFKNSSSTGKDLPVGVSFKDCVIYDSSFMISGNANFENCTFVGGPNNACVYINNDAAENSVINIKNCVFDSTVQRAINIASRNMVEVNITDCEFNGTSTVEKHIIQVATFNAKVTIDGCKFNALGTSPSIIRFNDAVSDSENYATLVDNITFTNNTISKDIPVEKYVDTDGKTGANATALDEAMTNKMK